MRQKAFGATHGWDRRGDGALKDVWRVGEKKRQRIEAKNSIGVAGGGYPPKVEQDSTETIWYAGLGLDTVTSFQPNGNVPAQLSASK